MPKGTNHTLIRFLYFLGVVRWYNIGLILLAQYATAAYIQLVYKTYPTKMDALWAYLADYTLHWMALATIFTVAAAFIINFFYDVDKDLVNKPNMALMGRAVGTKHLANIYILFNTLGLLFAFIASNKIFIFFIFYQIGCFFYSHKFQKLPIVRELTSGLLTMSPMLAVWLHFGIPSWELLYYFSALLLILFTKDVLKALSGHRGNLIFGYQTVAVAAGKRTTELGLTALNLVLQLIFWGSLFFINPTKLNLIYLSGFTIMATTVNSLLGLAQFKGREKWSVRFQKGILLLHVGGILVLLFKGLVLRVLEKGL